MDAAVGCSKGGLLTARSDDTCRRKLRGEGLILYELCFQPNGAKSGCVVPRDSRAHVTSRCEYSLEVFFTSRHLSNMAQFVRFLKAL